MAIVEQVATALNAAHEIGMVHGDLKPSNVLISDAGCACLTDFYSARKALGDEALAASGAVSSRRWAFSAPEQFSSGVADTRSDVYGLACVLHYCLTGRPPFPDSDLKQLISAHLSAPPPQPSSLRAGVPAELDPVITQGMAKDPGRRFPAPIDLAQAARAALGPTTRWLG